MVSSRLVAALCAMLCAATLCVAREADAQNRPRAARRPTPRTRVAAFERVLSEAQARTDAATASAAEAKTRADAATARADEAQARANDAQTRAAAATTRATEATQRAERAERRASEATTRAERAERRATEAAQRAERAEQRASEATTRATRAERRAAEANERAARAESRARELEATLAAHDAEAAHAAANADIDAITDAPTTDAPRLATAVRGDSAEDAVARPDLPAEAPRPVAPTLPAGRALAALSPDACLDLLRAQGVAFDRVPDTDAPGVTTPIRLRAPMPGIRVAPSNNPENSPHAVLDCRLALAVLAWAPVLRAADVVALEHYSAFRANARVGGSGPVSGHASGLALDAARLHLANGEVADVLTDWGDRTRGSEPCTPRDDEAPRARLLRTTVCEAVRADLFQIVITPHHDTAHQNHVHLELRPGVDWSYVH